MWITRRQILGWIGVLGGTSLLPDLLSRFSRPASAEPAPIIPKRTVEFHDRLQAYVIRDAQSVVRVVLHTQKPIPINANSACEAAATYLREHAYLLGIDASKLENLCQAPGDSANLEAEYRFLSEKPQFDVTTISFWETRLGVPVSRSGISVHLKKLASRFSVICVHIAPNEAAAYDNLLPFQQTLSAYKNAAPLRTEEPLGPANAKVLPVDAKALMDDLVADLPEESRDILIPKMLNRLRVWVPLPNLIKTDPQELSGRNVRIVDLEGVSAVPPKEDLGVDFDFDVGTDEFDAVNAYYYCDRFFTLVEELGFKRDDYFPWTEFPIAVDHRRITPCNSSCKGAATRATERLGRKNTLIKMGIEGVWFDEVVDWRLLLHELGGHGTLLNHVAETRFLFAHSAGDSIAAIINDPETNAADRGKTFPSLGSFFDQSRGKTYETLFRDTRYHNRDASQGWAWDGPKDTHEDSGLIQEQILSTTHFRLYQSIGGANLSDVDARRLASRYATYLILRAIQTLTPVTNPQHASDWLCNLIVADSGDWASQGHSGGAYEKIIWWAFEKQGLFGGKPPPVDVYIDDGRDGEYVYQSQCDNCVSIWNRHDPDDLDAHQSPVPNKLNYAYVKIKNRGTQTAKSVIVEAFQNRYNADRSYPEGWAPMMTGRILAQDVPPNKEMEFKIGPFNWLPHERDNRILMAVSADGDSNNLHKFNARKPISDFRLVTHDNNLACRKV